VDGFGAERRVRAKQRPVEVGDEQRPSVVELAPLTAYVIHDWTA
jgi:hypothetical protein